MKILKTKKDGNCYFALLESDIINGYTYTVSVRCSEKHHRPKERTVAVIAREGDKEFNVKMLQLVGVDAPQPVVVKSLEECLDVVIKEYISLCNKQKERERKILCEYIKDMKDDLKKIESECLHILEETDIRRIQEIIYILDEIKK